jgi:hypothetical protein
LRARQSLIRYRLPVIGKSLRDILTLYAHQKLPLTDGIAKAGANIHHAAGRQRNHGDVSRDVGADGASYVQLRSGFVLARSGQRKLLGMLDAEGAAVLFLLGLRRGGVSAPGSALPLLHPDDRSTRQAAKASAAME